MSGQLRVISFHWGEAYYRNASKVLREDCDRLGLPASIVEAPQGVARSWIQACRYKVRFISESLAQFDEPLLWIDVDCRILQRPLVLQDCRADLAFFLRGFREIRQFDPVVLPRTMQPSILYFGAGRRSREFMACVSDIERDHADDATDDFFLHEGWMRFPHPLSVLVLSPELVVFDEQPASPSACFRFGRSGQAGQYKDAARQHEAGIDSPARRKAVLLREAQEAGRLGKHAEERLFLAAAQRHDPSDRTLTDRVAGALYDRGRGDEAIKLFKGLPQDPDGGDVAARFLVDAALRAGRVQEAEAEAARLADAGSPGDRAWAEGRRLRIGLDKRARTLCLPASRRPAVSWMESPYPGNFGDILNPYIIERLSGVPPRQVPFGEGILAIGSTIRFARAQTPVWGAGTPRMSDRLDSRADFHAVRGPLTRQLVLESGGRCEPVYGDPAAFLPRLYRPRVPARPSHRLGVILHHAHAGLLRTAAGVKAISVLRAGYEGIEAFIDDLHDCERILSSSLHGLIVSHAYGIPARWFSVRGDEPLVPGDGTKFRDYLLSVALDVGEPALFDVGDEVTIEHAPIAEQLPSRGIDLQALIEVAPFRTQRRWWTHD
jgi:Polysaccharide pyruvyl transferase